MGVQPGSDDFIGEPGLVHHFHHLIWAYTLTGVLMAANKLDLFTALSIGPATPEELAARCGTQPTWTEKLLVACTALGLTERRGERYQNTSFVDRYLVRWRPAYQGGIIAHQHLWERWQELDHYVRTGARGPKEIRIKSEMSAAKKVEAHRIWIRAMHNIAMGGQADALANNDLVLLSGVLHGETVEDCRRMLRKAHDSLAPGGLVLVQEILLNDDKTEPLLPALFNLHMTYGAACTGREIMGWMQEVGFAETEVRYLVGYSWLNGLVVAKKPV